MKKLNYIINRVIGLSRIHTCRKYLPPHFGKLNYWYQLEIWSGILKVIDQGELIAEIYYCTYDSKKSWIRFNYRKFYIYMYRYIISDLYKLDILYYNETAKKEVNC